MVIFEKHVFGDVAFICAGCELYCAEDLILILMLFQRLSLVSLALVQKLRMPVDLRICADKRRTQNGDTWVEDVYFSLILSTFVCQG